MPEGGAAQWWPRGPGWRGPGTVEASCGPRRKGAQAQVEPRGPGWRRTRLSWGCVGAQDGGGSGAVRATLGGPELESGLEQLRPALFPDQRDPRHSQGLGAQDGGGPGTVGAALGPRMEEDQAQLGLLWGPGWWEARHSQSLVAALPLYSSTLIPNLKW